MRYVVGVHTWFQVTVRSLQERRDETGGVMDETGMMVVGIGAAGAIALVVSQLIDGISLDVNDLWPGD